MIFYIFQYDIDTALCYMIVICYVLIIIKFITNRNEKRKLLKAIDKKQELVNKLEFLNRNRCVGNQPMLKISCNQKNYEVTEYDFIKSPITFKERVFILFCSCFLTNAQRKHVYHDREPLLSIDCEYSPNSLCNSVKQFPTEPMRQITFSDLPSPTEVERSSNLRKARNMINRSSQTNLESMTNNAVSSPADQLLSQDSTPLTEKLTSDKIDDEPLDVLQDLMHRIADSEEEY
ncbi:hypothetical protein UA32_12080 [Photobacterium angustum]|uniref:Uncharacterized protein n=1 Tax=Photobacterium angustum TaxID=661 RepID=A0ABX5GYL6_PHOAN|nr:hypothetical protein [Photobacterium angustum]KJG37695.1 hypothetical protein UA32_12080 [Photobacterium angustum]PSX03973.1 hypothetical protein C0W27_20995 [Photobacterium angustum]